MARRTETTIERMYREVNGHKMSPSIKRILLPKRRRNWKAKTKSTCHSYVSRVTNGKHLDEEIRSAILVELRRIRSLLE
jgi:hypothetical protein